MNWIDRLKERWQVKGTLKVVLILVVFALTGTTVVVVKRPLFSFLFEDQAVPLWATITYYIVILPAYNAILLFYGLIFGQFSFFWSFEKRFFRRIFRTEQKPP